MTVLSVHEKCAIHFQAPWFLRNLLPFCVKTSPPGGNKSSLWPIFRFFSSSSSFESYCEVLVWTPLVLSYAHQHFESEPLFAELERHEVNTDPREIFTECKRRLYNAHRINYRSFLDKRNSWKASV